jgi:hypothetical protein
MGGGGSMISGGASPIIVPLGIGRLAADVGEALAGAGAAGMPIGAMPIIVPLNGWAGCAGAEAGFSVA